MRVLLLTQSFPRSMQSKGMKELMEAWRELRPQGWRLRLAGLGSAAYQKDLMEIVGSVAGVEFLGDLMGMS